MLIGVVGKPSAGKSTFFTKSDISLPGGILILNPLTLEGGAWHLGEGGGQYFSRFFELNGNPRGTDGRATPPF